MILYVAHYVVCDTEGKSKCVHIPSVLGPALHCTDRCDARFSVHMLP